MFLLDIYYYNFPLKVNDGSKSENHVHSCMFSFPEKIP